MFRYHLSCFVAGVRAWREGRKAAREMNRLLRANGFTEVAPGDWRTE